MNNARIEQIKSLGEKLAAYIQETDDQRFFRELNTLREGYLFRNALIRAARKAAARKTLLFTFDSFFTVFFVDEGETFRFDWKLARDLLFIRIIECLYEHGEKVDELISALPDESGEETSSSESTGE